MQERRDFKGKDLEEALQHAASALGIAEPELDYEIIEQGRKGLFGVGAKSVHIRVLTPIDEVSDQAILGRPDEPPAAKPRPKKRRPEAKRSERRPPIDDAPPPRAREARAPRERGPDRHDEHEERDDDAPLSPELENLQSTVGKMFELMGLRMDARVRPADNGASVDLRGADQKLLVQKDAELLAAMQFLLNRMARRTWPETGRIQLTCDGRRRRRDEDLVELTREVAEQVARTGKAKRLHSMNAYERRLVHLTVREYEGVASRSEGTGYLKKVRVFRNGSNHAPQPDS